MTKMKKVSLWKIFITFFKLGAFTFGGGYAMIALLQDELVTRKGWVSADDFADMVVVAESTPGVIAVNTATSVGYRLRGVWGAIIGTLGVVLPSFVIISALSYVLHILQNNVWYARAFAGVRACVVVLVLNAFFNLGRQMNKDVFSIIVAVVCFGLVTFVNLDAIGFDVIYLIIIGGIIGIVITLCKNSHTNTVADTLPLTESSALQDEEEQQ